MITQIPVVNNADNEGLRLSLEKIGENIEAVFTLQHEILITLNGPLPPVPPVKKDPPDSIVAQVISIKNSTECLYRQTMEIFKIL